MNGIVRRFNHDRGFGFIQPLIGKPDTTPDVFFHVSALRLPGRGKPSVPVGAEVQFQLVRGERGPQAANVRLVRLPASSLVDREVL